MKTPTTITLSCKIPVRIISESDAEYWLKHKALKKIANDCKYLVNIGYQYCAGFGLFNDSRKGLKPGENKALLGTKLYRVIIEHNDFVPPSIVTLLNNMETYAKFTKIAKRLRIGKTSLPCCNFELIPFRSSILSTHERNKKDDNGEVIKDENGEVIKEKIKKRKHTEIIKLENGQYQIKPLLFDTGGWLADNLIDYIKEEIKKGIEKSKKDKKNKSTDFLKILLSDINNLNGFDRSLTFQSQIAWGNGRAFDVMNRIISGEFALADSQIRFGKVKVNKDGGKFKKVQQFYLFIAYKQPVNDHGLDPDKVCGIDLGYNIPVYLAINNNLKREKIGFKNQCRNIKARAAALRRQKQKVMGSVSKSVKWEKSRKERDMVNDLYHKLTSRVIIFCLKNGCGTIHLEDLSSLRKMQMEKENNNFQRIVWLPGKFKDMLIPKAAKEGIIVRFINPRNTSKKCNKCGTIDDNNRSKIKASDFKCVNCGLTVHADYNAAKNISLSTDYVKVDKG